VLSVEFRLLLQLHPFNDLFPGQPGYAGTRKVNHSRFYWSKRWWGGSGISWTICKSFAPGCRHNCASTSLLMNTEYVDVLYVSDVLQW